MGGNCSYNEGWGGVPEANRTHTDSEYRIDKHKVVFLTKNAAQKKNILNSNSPGVTYLIASKDKEGNIKVHSVNIYDGHHLKCEINLEFDSKGNVISYNKSAKGSHSHYWAKDPKDGLLKRKKHDKSNIFAIDSKYNSLIKKVEKFNKENHK